MERFKQILQEICKLFKEEAPPKVNLKLTNDEIIQHLRNSFKENKSNIIFKTIAIDNKK